MIDWPSNLSGFAAGATRPWCMLRNRARPPPGAGPTVARRPSGFGTAPRAQSASCFEQSEALRCRGTRQARVKSSEEKTGRFPGGSINRFGGREMHAIAAAQSMAPGAGPAARHIRRHGGRCGFGRNGLTVSLFRSALLQPTDSLIRP